MPYPTRYKVTPREYEVWELIAHGATQRDIARLLRGPAGRPLSMQTVKNYVSALLRRVGVTSSLELAVVWYGGDLLRAPCPDIEPPRMRAPTPLKERATLMPTRGTAERATNLTAEERMERAAAHPWRHIPASPLRVR